MEGFLVEGDSRLEFERGFGYIQKGKGNGILDMGNSLARIAGTQAGVGEQQNLERQPGSLDFMPSEGLDAGVLLEGRLCVRP